MEPLTDASLDIAVSLAATRSDAGEPVLFAARRSGLSVLRPHAEDWTSAFTSLDSPPATTAVAVSPGDIVYAGVNGGILRSADLASTWSAIPFSAPPPLVACIACSPRFADVGIVLAGTLEDGMFRSTDRGLTWQPANVGLLDMAVLAIAMAPDPRGGFVAILGTDTGVFLSENGGRSWRETGFPDLDAPVTAVAISPRFAEDGLVLAGTDGAGLFRSRDLGSTWEPIGKDLPGTHVIATYVMDGPNDIPAVLAVISEGAYISPDGGDAWHATPLTLPTSERIVAASLLDDSALDFRLAIALESGPVWVV